MTLGAQYFDTGFAESGHIEGFEGVPCCRKNSLAQGACLAVRIDAVKSHVSAATELVGIGGTDFVGVGRGPSGGAGDQHAVVADLFYAGSGEIAHHVREHIGLRVADFVQHLFAHGADIDQASGVVGFGADEAAVTGDLSNGVTHVHHAGHLVPVGEVAAGGLGAAFQDVAGQRSHGQLVHVVAAPAKGVYAGTQCDCAVYTAACDHNVGAQLKRPGDREGAQVGVDTLQLIQRRERLSRKHFGDACSLQLLFAVHQVIAHDTGDLQIQALLLYDRAQGLRAGRGIDPAGIGYYLDTTLGDQSQVGFHRRAHEVQGIAPGCVLGPGSGHDGHGDLGQVIVNNVIQPVRVQ